MRGDEERLHAQRAEAESRLALREAAARQQTEQASAALKAAEAAREDEERRLAARLAEVAAQEAVAVRARAAAEAEVARVTLLQSQLCAALEEQGALRQQLASSQAAHQAELAVLREVKERPTAAAAPPAPAAAATAAESPQQGLSPADSARLQQAVRRLMQRVEQLQGEVEAGRQHERVWRDSTGRAEKLLGKVGLVAAGAAHMRRLACHLRRAAGALTVLAQHAMIGDCTVAHLVVVPPGPCSAEPQGP